MVKVLSRGGRDLRSVQRHLGYIGRKGLAEIETDDGERLTSRSYEKALLEDWDLDLEENSHSGNTAELRRQPKLVHKLMLSMPPGTPGDRVLAAARAYLREEFALRHRYAFVLHADERHPHVHAVVKAVSERGVRLHIRKATLRRWRHDFASHSREQGIEANATERAVRGETRTAMKDGIYRAMLRAQSTYMHERAAAIESEATRALPEAGKRSLSRTRHYVESGWYAVAARLNEAGYHDLAGRVLRFLDRMHAPMTEREWHTSEPLSPNRAPFS